MFLILPLWIITAFIYAFQRSFWCDEMVRLHQSSLNLSDGLRALFGEPSPMAPGEMVLDRFFRILTEGFLPPEIWGRLPGIFWGAGFIWLSIKFARRHAKFKFLPWLSAFSVSVLTVSVQLRPYGSLMFAGAVAALMILEEQDDHAIQDTVLFWITVFFAHIYGICFVALAAIKRKQWLKAVVGFIFTAFILTRYHIVPNQGGSGGQPPLSVVIRQILGALSNPHKAVIVMLPLFLLGYWTLWRTSKKTTIWLSLLFGATLVAPTLVTFRSGYFFVPRQNLGGLFPFLALAALGFDTVAEKFPINFRWRKYAYGLACFIAALPWISSVIFKAPPFPDQPLHRFREIAQNIVRQNKKNILLIDPCHSASMVYYLTRATGTEPNEVQGPQVEGFNLSKTCWTGETCLYVVNNMKYCSMDPREVEKTEPLGKLVNTTQESFDAVIYDIPQLVLSDTVAARRSSIRAW